MTAGAIAAPHQITIDVFNGEIVYNPPDFSLHVLRQEQVNWTSRFAFAITFGERTPMEEGAIFAVPAGGTARAKVQKKAVSGPYKYSVTVFPDPNGPPLVDDPEIYVD